MNNSLNVPIWEKYSLSIKEAAHYFNTGENKIRKMKKQSTGCLGKNEQFH